MISLADIVGSLWYWFYLSDLAVRFPKDQNVPCVFFHKSLTDEHLECTGCPRKTWKRPCLLSWHLEDCVWLANDPRSLCILLAWLHLCKYFIFSNLKMQAGKDKLTGTPKDWFHASVSVIFNSSPSCLDLLPSWRRLWGQIGAVGSWENLLPVISLSVLLERNVYCSFSSRVENIPARTPGKLDSDLRSKSDK